MKRILGLLVVAAGFTFTACGSSDKKVEDTVVFTPQADGDAIIGSWGSGAETFTFQADGKYTYKQARSGRADLVKTGTYNIRKGAVFLTPEGGEAEVYDFQFSNQQNSINFSSNAGKSYNLVRK